ncbi:hypothetical protein [Bifidobacterium aemilianum]|nr:hypothetical protein [Bifidobacterium aemilianum]
MTLTPSVLLAATLAPTKAQAAQEPADTNSNLHGFTVAERTIISSATFKVKTLNHFNDKQTAPWFNPTHHVYTAWTAPVAAS